MAVMTTAVTAPATIFAFSLLVVERMREPPAPVLLEGTKVIAYLTSPEVREHFLRGYETIHDVWKQKTQSSRVVNKPEENKK